jgi:DegV family protein with EDD domain
MSVIFCDSNCELWHTHLKELKYNVISMPYTIAEQEYFYDNGEKTDFKKFYDMVREGKMPITSALNRDNYIEYFEPFFKQGEEILYVSFSEKMSGTFNFMNQAIEELKAKYPKAKFTRFDTKSISMGAGLQVYLAGKFFRAGHSVEETLKYLESITGNVSMMFMVDSLNHLKRGGRLSTASAFFGSLMQIKPVLKVNNEGSLYVYSKQKGQNKAVQYIIDELKTNYQELDGCPISVLDADNPEYGDKLYEGIKEAFPDKEIWRQPIGPTVGTHCGPGTVAVCFPAKAR